MPEQTLLADFSMSGASAIPAAILDESRAAAAAVGYARGWSEGMRGAETAMADARSRAELEVAAVTRAAAARTAETAAALGACLTQLHDLVTQACARDEQALLAAAVSLAEVLVGRELIAVDTAALAAVRRALSLMDEPTTVTVRLNPTAAAALRAADLDTQLADLGGAARLRLVDDASLATTDAVAESSGITVDARLNTAIERARAALAGDLS